MSKDKKSETTANEFENAEATTAATTTEAPAAAAGDADGRHILITDPDTGEQIKRVDFIKREVIQRGRQRGDVAKQLTTIQGKKVPYQIVFAATKGFKPKKPEDAPVGGEAAPAAEQAAAAE